MSLDFTLGLRMLAKYPGLTFVGVLGISVAVIIGAFAFAAVRAITGAALPLDEGDRVVAIDNVKPRGMGDGSRTHLHDLAIWREALTAVEDLGACRFVTRNFIAADSLPEALSVAEITASGFHLARVAPIVGRYLTNDDERPGTPDVVVIGYDLWKRKLGGRADIVGSTVQLGPARHTVIGVMPKGFAFPFNNQIWTPLRLNPTAYERGEAPAINVFGRLAPGASLADARLQLATIGHRLAAAYPRSHERIQPRLIPYAQRFFADLSASSAQVGRVSRLLQIIVGLLLLVVATNVAVLVYARTANRAGELALRTAVGASRRRIVVQLFAEALVLSGVASATAIVIAYFVFHRVDEMIRQSASNLIPYWMRLELTPGVIAYVAGLAVFAAIVIGVIPGLKATRDRVSENLKDLSGGSSMRLGRTWTALLIAQVAASVAALPFALGGTRMLMSLALLDVGAPATRSLVIATPTSEDVRRGAFAKREDARMARVRYTNHIDELVRRLETEAGFNVFRMSSSPGRDKSTQPVEIERSPTDSAANTPYWSVGIGEVDARYFLAFNLPVLAGRSFAAGDFASGAPAVIVNRSFVQWYLGGGNALGRRLRPDPERSPASTRPQAWWEIVGVVEDLLVPGEGGPGRARVYLPLLPDGIHPMTLAVRGPPGAAVSDRVRKIAMTVDPTLRFATIQSLGEMFNDGVKWDRLGIVWLVMVMLCVILLSAAGIYALMSFTVTRRQREIGIRSALGAPRRRVLAEVLSRAMRQIGIGIAIGIPGSGVVARLAGDSDSLRLWFVLQPAAMMLLVGLIATIGPARRALRVQPTEALRTD